MVMVEIVCTLHNRSWEGTAELKTITTGLILHPLSNTTTPTEKTQLGDLSTQRPDDQVTIARFTSLGLC